MDVADMLLRSILTVGHRFLKACWFVRRPRTLGAHALAFTPERRLILVRLRYAPGWRLPGGGRTSSEDPRDAVLRELREEIGMTSHGQVRLARELDNPIDFREDLASLLIVDDVRYHPHWSWEVERIIETPLVDLPDDLAPVARDWIAAARDRI